MPTNPGDYAHPKIIFSDGCSIIEGGLTKREHFATMAMQAILTNPDPALYVSFESYAKSAVCAADVLIRILNEPPDESMES